MKVAICTHDYPNYTGGTNVWLTRITAAFKSKGIEPVVLFTKGKNTPEYRYVSEIRNNNIKSYIYSGQDYTEHKINWILSVLNKEMPDIFIPNYDIPGLFAARWAMECGIPSVGMLRSNDHIYDGILERFVIEPGPFRLTALVCVSEFLSEKAKSYKHDTIVKRIPSGTPIPDRVAKWDSDLLRMVYTGRIIEKQKKISDLTYSLCNALKKVEGTEAVLYGSGDSVESVLRIIEEEGAGLPVSYGGVVPTDKIQEKLLQAQLFVLLSDYEGLSTSLMEAMACGLVPICLNIVSGTPELVKDGETGLLVNNRGEDFVRAVQRVKSEDGLWEKLSKAARQKVIEDYSTENSAKKWINLFEELLHSNSIPKSRIPIQKYKEISLPEIHPNLLEHRWRGRLFHYYKRSRSKVYGFASKSKNAVLNIMAGKKKKKFNFVGKKSKREKILVYNDCFFRLSETFLYQQVKILSDNYDVHLLARKFVNPQGFDITQFEKHVISLPESMPGRVVGKIYRTLFNDGIYLNVSSIRYLNRLFQQNRFKAIHAHFGDRAMELLGIAKKYKVPMVVTFHGHDASAMLKNPAYKNQLPDLFDYASDIILVSGHMTESLGLKPWMDKVHIIPCAVDPEKINIDEEKKANENIQIVHAGRLTGKKGVPDLIHVFHQLTEEMENIELIIAGDGSDMSRCVEIVEEYGLQNKVRLLGAVSHDRIKELLNQADIFVLNSRVDQNGDMEGTPVTLLEAMCIGRAVVSTLHAGIPYVVKDGKNGLLVNERSNSELKTALKRLIKNPELRESLGREAKKTIELSHTAEALKNQIQGIFDRL